MHDHPATTHPDLVVGISGADDAGVMRMADGTAIVQTVDFFTPIVDDPYDWGRITAANALSDIYAMGADPLTALQMVGWPRDDLPMDLLAKVIEGGADVMAEAGCVIVGGHSIDDKEPKYGFAVTGTAPVDELMTNASAQVGDAIYLTKPLGTGVITTAIKQGAAADAVRDAAVSTMTTLNRAAAGAARRVGVRAATDVTGFGLIGHLAEVVKASNVSARIKVDAVPLLDGAREAAEAGTVPGGTKRNLRATTSMLDRGTASDTDVVLLSDAQTSGGLLVMIDTALASAFEQALEDAGAQGWRIGSIIDRDFSHGPVGQIVLG